MASDEDYMAFLNKANEDASGGQQANTAAAGAQSAFKTTDAGIEIPKEIQEVCQKGEVYVSDADEPFEPVALKWAGEDGLPDEGDTPRPPISGRWTARLDTPRRHGKLWEPLALKHKLFV